MYKKHPFEKGNKLYFGRSHVQLVGVVLEASSEAITVAHVELGCFYRKPQVRTFTPDESVKLISEDEWVKRTQDEPAFMTRDRYLDLQCEREALERAIAEGHDTEAGETRLELIELVMNEAPWTLHPDYGCIAKTEAALIEALEEVSQQLRDHPDVSRGNSKVHYCYHKAEGALKDAADRRVMPTDRFMTIQPAKPQFYFCGICGEWHPAGSDGDCRDDANRFTYDQLDAKYGVGGWAEVNMPA